MSQSVDEPFSLRDKAVFVTGGARGIGRGVAEALAEAGADVGVGDLDLEGARETARLVDKAGRRSLPVALDVTQTASLEAAASATFAAFGRLDGWVNNAGVLRMSPALDARGLASPKSVRYTWSSRPSRTFDGFTSRCSIPRAWAASSAAPTWRTICAARIGSSWRSKAISARRSVPSTSRIVM